MATKDLQDTEAATKLKELAEDIDFAMLCTDLSELPIHSVPMSTKKVDDAGNIWFLSGHDSSHNGHIRYDSKVQLIYSDPSSMRFLTVFGEAEILSDPSILVDLYGAMDDAWFNGVNDPNLSAIKIRPIEAHYWDTKSNRFIAMVKMGIGAVTGNEPDLMNQGDITL